MLSVGNGEEYIDTIEIKTTNWQIFPQKVSQKITEIPRIETKENLEEQIRKLQDNIIQAANESSRIRRTERVRNDDILPYHLRRKIQIRRACKRQYRNFQNEENRRRLNDATSELRRALKQHAENKWQNKLESLDTTDGSLWKITKALRNPKERIPPLHGSRGGIVYTDTEKAEAMADALERECVENNHEDDDEDHENLVLRTNNRFRREPQDDEIPDPSTPGEVKEIIKNIKTKKAPGMDGVSNKMLKKLPRKGIAAISNIINAMMRLRHYPAEWKTAEVIMLPKPNKDRTFPQNYRPISLLPAISKIAERAIQKRMWTATDELNILPDEQFGFRRGHSSEHQVLRTVEFAADGFATRRSTGLVLLDIERAFDRVWREGLIYKMNLLGYPKWITRITDSYLKDRKLIVKIGEKRSTIRQTEAGTPQGAVLSPLLYNIYTSDIPRNRNTQLGLFADDTAIAARSTQAWMVTQKLQQHLDQINEWLIKWKIHPNVEKTKATYITKRRQRPEVELNLDGQNISWGSEAKYLGVTIDNKLTWKKHIEEARRKGNFVFSKIYPLINRKSKLSRKMKLLLIKSLVRPVITYGSAVWGYAADSHLKKLEGLENKLIRIAMNAPWYVRNTQIHREMGWTPLRTFMKNKAEKTFNKAETHENVLIREAVAYQPDEQPRRNKKRPRNQIL